MFRNVVVGYDGSERGGDAVALAERLRDPRKGMLVLVSAYPVPSLTDETMATVERRDAFELEAEASVTEARKLLGPDVPTRVSVVPAASPARALTEVAERDGADLVVVGSTHRGRFGRVVLGTTAERLLHGAPCAVAVAPRGYAGDELRHIGVAYDGSPEAEAALDTAEAIATECGAVLTCYCVIEPAGWADGIIAAGTGAEWPSETLKRHARRMLTAVTDHAPEGIKLETRLLRGEPAEEIARKAAAGLDLLAVGSRGYGPLRCALLGSVSGRLVREASCPVLVMPRSAVVPRRVPTTAAKASA
ncbi:MAG: universal stress protein [Candidatus Limnocylindria bacterium]